MTSITHTVDTPLMHDRSWTEVLLHTDRSLTQTLLRLTLAVVLLPHGAQHLLGWFGGYGFSGTVGWMSTALGIPPAVAGASILLEFFGPLALIAGIGSRLAGFSLGVFMAVAASTHLPNGFFMNWGGTMPAGTEGFEYHLLALALTIAVTVRGGGAFSLDAALTSKHGH